MQFARRLAASVFLSAVALSAASLAPGTKVEARLGQTISSATAKAGDHWEGTLAADLMADGKAVARRGDPVRGIVADAKPSGRLSAPGVLKLRLTSVRIDGVDTPVRTNIRSRQGGSHKTRDTEAIGGGAAAGAIIGAIAGGGKGAAIGAGAGAAAGTAGAAATGKKDVTYPAETVVTFVVQ